MGEKDEKDIVDGLFDVDDRTLLWVAVAVAIAFAVALAAA